MKSMIELLTATELAELLKVKVETLQNWRWGRKGPPYIKFEGKVRYEAKAVRDWIAEKITHGQVAESVDASDC